MNQGTLRLSNHINADALFWVLFASLSSVWATILSKLLGPNEKETSIVIPRTQQGIASWGIDPAVSNLLITNPTLFQLNYRPPLKKIVNMQGLVFG